jgi:hypothetical protein
MALKGLCMDPATGTGIATKAVGGMFAWAKNWWHRERHLKARIAQLEAELAAEKSGEPAFERLMSTLVCRQQDDHMWFKKDGSGGPYCPVCQGQTKKIIPLMPVSGRTGEFECFVHDRRFMTAERRRYVEQNPPRPIRRRIISYGIRP